MMQLDKSHPRKQSTIIGSDAGECLEAVSGELSFFTLPTCFELFGFDLVVDEAWHVWLLEVRAGRAQVFI